jgi:hypothetical protein
MFALCIVLLCVFLCMRLQGKCAYFSVARAGDDAEPARILWAVVAQSAGEIPALERAAAYYGRNPLVNLACLVPAGLEAPRVTARLLVSYRVPRARIYSEFPKGESHICSVPPTSDADRRVLTSWLALRSVPPGVYTHVAALPLSSGFGKLESVRCCAATCLVVVEEDGVADLEEAAVGFRFKELVPCLEVLQDMTHLSSLRLRLSALKSICSFAEVGLARARL